MKMLRPASEIIKQIKEFKAIFNGVEKPPAGDFAATLQYKSWQNHLQELKEEFLLFLPDYIEKPAIVPTTEGNILFEWQTAGSPSLDFNIDTMIGEYHSFHPTDTTKTFLLETEEDWKFFFDFFSEEEEKCPEGGEGGAELQELCEKCGRWH